MDVDLISNKRASWTKEDCIKQIFIITFALKSDWIAYLEEVWVRNEIR